MADVDEGLGSLVGDGGHDPLGSDFPGVRVGDEDFVPELDVLDGCAGAVGEEDEGAGDEAVDPAAGVAEQRGGLLAFAPPGPHSEDDTIHVASSAKC
ncbi:hypothetical protein [Actinoalloteichus caeruleus]|uniref:hypothetical protein n=1 Tax=Actinoalloteichus cyanogriseus TaxID=2893586 RepID=UPI003BB963B8